MFLCQTKNQCLPFVKRASADLSRWHNYSPFLFEISSIVSFIRRLLIRILYFHPRGFFTLFLTCSSKLHLTPCSLVSFFAYRGESALDDIQSLIE